MDDRHPEKPLRVPVLDRYNDRGTMVLGKVEQVSLSLLSARDCVCTDHVFTLADRASTRTLKAIRGCLLNTPFKRKCKTTIINEQVVLPDMPLVKTWLWCGVRLDTRRLECCDSLHGKTRVCLITRFC